jgi:hypothetical protein
LLPLAVPQLAAQPAETSDRAKRQIESTINEMSALGQNRTWRGQITMSALHPKADIPQHCLDVRFGPFPDKLHRSKIGLLDHLIRSGEEGASSSSSSPRRHRLMRDCEKPSREAAKPVKP